MKNSNNNHSVTVKDINKAYRQIKKVVHTTPLELSERLSKKYGCRIYLKREDLQCVRSYKIRGAYNLISQLTPKQRKKGVVCASAGNHAQGVALSCKLIKIKGRIFMPKPTPKQKINRVKTMGEKWVELELVGDTFDETNELALEFAQKHNKNFVHPFNNPKVIAGQGTVGLEIFRQLHKKIDFVVAPIGGGGLTSGLGTYIKNHSPKTKLIGVEPEGAACMKEAFKRKKPTQLSKLNKFVDGAAVSKAGELTYKICKKVVDKILTAPENKICMDMISLYQSDGIIAEPAGALTISALDSIIKQIKNKTVVCIISGGNNDISRYDEIAERSLIYQGLKHYFMIEFAQRPGALRRYLDEALGKEDDITLFEYVKKNNRESGPALVGVELSKKQNLTGLLSRMNKIGLKYELLKPDSVFFKFLI